MRHTMHARMMRSVSRDAKERIAVDVFNFENLWLAIKAASQRGKERVQIYQDVPLDLSQTDAAKDATDLLVQRGFQLVWEDASEKIVLKRRETGKFLFYRELVIKWDQKSEDDATHLDRMVGLGPTYDDIDPD